MILWLTLGQLGVGLLLTLWFTGPREVGLGFPRFLAVAAAASLAPLAAASSGTVRWTALAGAVGAALGGVLLSWGLGRGGQLLARLAALPAAVALVVAVLPYRRPGPPLALQEGALAVDALTSAGLLGLTGGAMILGHWYLVNTEMPIAPLTRLAAAIGVASGVKLAVLACVLVLYGFPTSPEGIAFSLLVPPGLFYVVRISFGIAGPLAMSPMVWHTARMHATQSATGILYAAVVLVLVGEMTSNFLLTRTPLPF